MICINKVKIHSNSGAWGVLGLNKLILKNAQFKEFFRFLRFIKKFSQTSKLFSINPPNFFLILISHIILSIHE